VAANHLSYADWAAMALFIHEAGRYPAFLIKSSAFNVKGVGPFLRAAGQFPVNRGATDAALVLNDAERGLAHGECLLFYPQGTACAAGHHPRPPIIRPWRGGPPGRRPGKRCRTILTGRTGIPPLWRIRGRTPRAEMSRRRRRRREGSRHGGRHVGDDVRAGPL